MKPVFVAEIKELASVVVGRDKYRWLQEKQPEKVVRSHSSTLVSIPLLV